MTQPNFDKSLQAEISSDDRQKVRAINHTSEYFQSSETTPLRAAVDYLHQVCGTFGIPDEQLSNLPKQVSYLDPVEKNVEYGLQEEKKVFDSHTYSFAQTYMNIPVWESGVKVTCKDAPCRIVSAVNTSEDNVKAKLPSKQAIKSFRKLFPRNLHDGAPAEEDDWQPPAQQDQAKLIYEALGVAGAQGDAETARDEDARIIRGRFYVYRYDESQRLPGGGGQLGVQGTEGHDEPALPLPKVDKKIKDGDWYVVAEITFSYSTPDYDHINWRMLVELETKSVLYLRALSSGAVSGSVFLLDPISATGDTTLTSDQDNTRLNPLRNNVTLSNLEQTNSGVQSLRGKYVKLVDVHAPTIAAPTESSGTGFDYDVRTNNYAAVSAYFHTNQIFEVIESLGFPISSYFSNTNFPIQVDHRGMNNRINAHCVGDGIGGISHACYGIMDTTNLAQPLGRACDPRVHWHELCGHGILYESVDGPNFHFAHSAGDGISGIFFDPESRAPGAKRFEYVPWHPTLRRRFDRNVSDGWAWGGWRDDRGYRAEEILATCHFRIYQSIGGDSPYLGRRRFASRMMMYLILRTIQNLTPASNPRYAREFAEELMAVDRLDWTSEGVVGGAYNKVIRWSFEKQGEYQTPLVTRNDPRFGTIVSPGNPPDEDVYIDDGREGEYEYQHIHWNTTTIWNRHNPDGLEVHQNPIQGTTNYAYVKIRNRGTKTANGVMVRGFHCKPTAGILWPTDLQPFLTPEITVGTINGNNTEEKIVGPFKWIPIINAHGHDSMMMMVSSERDRSNVDNLTSTEVIPEWRLVPNDNNIAQRNVQVVSGANVEALKKAFDGISFWVGNPNNTISKMKLDTRLPKVLTAKGWKLSFGGLGETPFALRPGRQKEIDLVLEPGEDFSASEVEASGDKDIVVFALADDNFVGGITYRLDPTLGGGETATVLESLGSTRDLLKNLTASAGNVKSVKVRRVILDIEFDE
ncbi:MAG: hypothetical protein QNJ54_21795 [Prochloraceae cyanobacterium]|nr:hypothetical protein [Prochloraceae cyanobacterium]